MTEPQLTIATTWDGTALPATEHTFVRLAATAAGLTIGVDAPYAADPVPVAPVGRTERLWEHEVVEVFFAESAARSSRYLEIELGPHGHWLALGFSSYRRVHIADLALTYSCTIDRATRRWQGQATIDWLEVARVLPEIGASNAYAIRGGTFMAAWPVPAGAFPSPDFHRIDYFR